MKKLPPITIIVGIIILIGGLVFVLKYASKESLTKIKLGGKTIEVSEEHFKDSDNDGLRDWEEELYKTDPFNPDTDNDGYLDGEEVDSGHNPLVKAPGDKLGFHPLPLGKKYNITEKILNQEAVSNLLLSYLAQKADYLENHPEIKNPEQFTALTDPSTIKEIARRSVYDSYNYLVGPNEENILEILDIFEITITDEQIKISQDNSQEAVQLYISEISQWLNSDVFFFQDEALQIIANAFKNSDFSALDKLIKLNDSWIEQMKEIIVPSSWKEIHKRGLEIIILFRNIFVSLRDYQSDPFKAYYAAEQLEKLSYQWNNLIKQAIALAKSQGIELQF